MRLCYTLLFHAAVPFLWVRLWWKGRRQPGYRSRIGERFGWYTESALRHNVIWIHAVSVGECEAAFPLIRQLLADPSLDRPLLVTCTTPTGSARIREVLGDTVSHVYLPYDLPFAVRRFLEAFRPSLGLIMETEIWPNLFQACYGQQIPLAIINGRLSEKSMRGYGHVRGLIEETLRDLTLIAAQTTADAERYVRLGADPDRVKVTGNIKFDVQQEAGLSELMREVRSGLFGNRPVWIAGSTHPGEEEIILEAQAMVRETLPDVLLILAPRHPERTQAVRQLCASRGFVAQARSDQSAAGQDTSVFLLDTLGELRRFYAGVDVAFIGGSLIPHGGQNVLEAAMAGIPVLFGPHVGNFRVICENLLETGAAVQVDNADELARGVTRFLTQPETAMAYGERGRAYVESNRGALANVLALIHGLMGQGTQKPVSH
jgi:3-deoxy-D-manno-octulosonic-acid transferase